MLFECFGLICFGLAWARRRPDVPRCTQETSTLVRGLVATMGPTGAHKRETSVLVRELVATVGHKGTHKRETGAVATTNYGSQRDAKVCDGRACARACGPFAPQGCSQLSARQARLCTSKPRRVRYRTRQVRYRCTIRCAARDIGRARRDTGVL